MSIIELFLIINYGLLLTLFIVGFFVYRGYRKENQVKIEVLQEEVASLTRKVSRNKDWEQQIEDLLAMRIEWESKIETQMGVRFEWEANVDKTLGIRSEWDRRRDLFKNLFQRYKE